MDKLRVFKYDLPPEVLGEFLHSKRIAWDIETNGLEPRQAQIGTCQLYSPSVGPVIVTGLAGHVPTRLGTLLSREDVVKVFHHAPFDLSFMVAAWGYTPKNIACTKIAAKLIAPKDPSDHYSLQYLMRHHFGLELDKKVRFTNWLSDSLSDRQLEYAVGDVSRLLDLFDVLEVMLEEKDLKDLYNACLEFLPTHVQLRLHGCSDPYKY